MSISTANYLLVGTGAADESATPASVANNGASAGAVVDLLGDDTSIGDVELYLSLTSTVTAGLVQVRFVPQRRLNGGTPDYTKPPTAYDITIPPTNGVQKLALGRRACPRYASADVFNAATGASCSVSLLAKVIKSS